MSHTLGATILPRAAPPRSAAGPASNTGIPEDHHLAPRTSSRCAATTSCLFPHLSLERTAMNTAPPASSSRMRLLNRDRYFYAQLPTDPHQAATSCADYWVSTGARNGTPGMREQLASHGWIGTELVTGSYARHFAMSSFFDEIPIIGLFPSLAPRSIKHAHHHRRSRLLGGWPPRERAVVFRRQHHFDGPDGHQRLYGHRLARSRDRAPQAGHTAGHAQTLLRRRSTQRPPVLLPKHRPHAKGREEGSESQTRSPPRSPSLAPSRGGTHGRIRSPSITRRLRSPDEQEGDACRPRSIKL